MLRSLDREQEWVLLERPPDLTLHQAIERLKAETQRIASAEPDFAIRLSGTSFRSEMNFAHERARPVMPMSGGAVYPSDPMFPQQWGLLKIRAPLAWGTVTDASEVVVAVFDTGIDPSHPDLAPNLWIEPVSGKPGFTCQHGGIVAGGEDDHGHGTHVSGIIGASANGVGTVGVVWGIRLLSMKILDGSGVGHVSDAIVCLSKAAELRRSGVNIRVANHSWGLEGKSDALEKTLQNLEQVGVLQVVAAGNHGRNIDIAPVYPAAFRSQRLISVANSTASDQLLSNSNFGFASVDLSAPGHEILSTVPAFGPISDATRYRKLSGTSMAAPHVTGVAAAILQLHPMLSPEEVRDLLLSPQALYATGTSSSTGGRLDFFGALSLADDGEFKRNQFPEIRGTVENPTLRDGETALIPVSTFDPDGDDVGFSLERGGVAELSGLPALVWRMVQLFPAPPIGEGIGFTGFPVAEVATMPYALTARDGRGGADLRHVHLTVLPTTAVPPPAAVTLSASATQVSPGASVTFTMSIQPDPGVDDPWQISCSQPNGAFFAGTPVPFYTRVLSTPGFYRCRAYATDPWLRVLVSPSIVVRVGSVAGAPPIIEVNLSAASGPAPLEVSIDASATWDDGVVTLYFFACDPPTSAPGISSPVGTCTFDTPGPHLIRVHVRDNAGHRDVLEVPIMVTPPELQLPQPPGDDEVRGPA